MLVFWFFLNNCLDFPEYRFQIIENILSDASINITHNQFSNIYQNWHKIRKWLL
jgi:hypothetical protein